MRQDFQAVDHGREQPFFVDASRSLTVAQADADPLLLPFAGTFLGLTSDSGSVRVRLNSRDAPMVTLRAGDRLEGPTVIFNRVFVSWDAQSGETFALVFAVGASLVPGSVNVVSGVSVKAALNLSGNTAVSVTTATLLSAADASRRSIGIQPTDGDIYVGESGVTTSDGIYVAQNSLFVLETQAAVYAIAAAGTVDVRVIEETD